MIRQLNIFAISFVVCISIADAFMPYSLFPPMAGGHSPVPAQRCGELKSQLESSNMGSALGGTASVRILNILSATQQVVAGMKYHILATVSIDGRTEKCCFIVHHSLPPQRRFNVLSAEVGVQEC